MVVVKNIVSCNAVMNMLFICCAMNNSISPIIEAKYSSASSFSHLLRTVSGILMLFSF